MRYRYPIMLFLAVSVTYGILASYRLGIAEEGVAAKPKDTAVFMRAKLASSQKVLDGLVSKDFGLIAAGAKELERMSEADAFQQFPDPVYRHYSREFRRQAAKLNRLGVDRNLDGASFTYMHAVTTCIACHEYVRDVIRVADAEDLDRSPRARNVRAAINR